MGLHAKRTSAAVERSGAEIEKVPARHGAGQVTRGWGNQRAVSAFRAKERFVKFDVPLRSLEDKRASP